MKISCIIPTAGDHGCLRECLSQIARQDFSQKDTEVIVVGNLDSSDLRILIHSFRSRIKNLKLIFSGRIGVNFARNAGIVAAIGDFLVFLDDDCVPKHDNYFSKLIEIHEQNPHATAVGGFYLAAENAGMLTNAYIEISRSWLEGSMYREGNSFNLLGGNVSYRKENLGTIYRFNSHIRFGGAETEFHSRLVKAGHEFVLSNDIPVIHYASLSFMGFVYRAYMQGYRWLEIKEAGMAPSFRVSPKKSRPMNRPLKLIFSFFFRLGEDWARIKLYEDTFIRQCFELIRLRFMRTVEILRSSKMLREFCHFSLYLAQERRRLRLKKIEDEFSR